MLLHWIYFANLKTLCYFTKQILPIIATKKAATIEEAGEVLHTEKVDQRGGKSKHFEEDLTRLQIYNISCNY